MIVHFIDMLSRTRILVENQQPLVPVSRDRESPHNDSQPNKILLDSIKGRLKKHEKRPNFVAKSQNVQQAQPRSKHNKAKHPWG